MLLILNDVAGSEIILILVFVLIFFGSKSIPGLAKTMGRTIRQIKDASSDIQNEIKKSGADMKKDLNLTGIIEETAQDIKRPLDQYAQDIDNAVKYQSPSKPSHLKPKEEAISTADGKEEKPEVMKTELKKEEIPEDSDKKGK